MYSRQMIDTDQVVDEMGAGGQVVEHAPFVGSLAAAVTQEAARLALLIFTLKHTAKTCEDSGSVQCLTSDPSSAQHFCSVVGTKKSTTNPFSPK